MPPKPSSSKAAKHQSSNKGALDAINAYLSQKPDLDQLIREAKENPRWSLPEKRQTEYDLKIKEAVREVLIERSKQAEGTGQTITMPSHPKDGSESSGQDAKDSKSSNVKATVQDHKAAPGPVITTENLGEPASKEELRKRAEELNKK